jgi:hypothetical protein
MGGTDECAIVQGCQRQTEETPTPAMRSLHPPPRSRGALILRRNNPAATIRFEEVHL